MRKIDELVRECFMFNEPLNKSNTKVCCDDFTTELYLHGHLIASKNPRVKDSLKITNCGYFTNTTKSRLNAIPGVNIYQEKGVWYLNGDAWDGNWINIKQNV